MRRALQGPMTSAPLLLTALLAAGPAVAQTLMPDGRPPAPPADREAGLVLSVGRFDALRGTTGTRGEAGLRFRPTLSVAGFTGELGLAFNAEGGGVAHFSIAREIAVWRLTFRPSLGLGGYRAGSGKDLGSTFQFRSGLEVSTEFLAGRIGVEIYHLSNAGLTEHNPGEESLVVTYAMPMRRWLSAFRR
jgi:hypothetical protein